MPQERAKDTEGVKSSNSKSDAKISPLVCIDLFAGAGGFSLAAKRAGFRVAAAVEIDEHACATYTANLIYKRKKSDRPKLYPQNILDLDPKKILEENFSENSSCDVVLGGPPCQGFSVHRINGAGIGDPRNKLILRYFKFVECLKPKVFLMENVPVLLWPRHGWENTCRLSLWNYSQSRAKERW